MPDSSITAYFGGDTKGLREATEEGKIIIKGFSGQAARAFSEIGKGFVAAVAISELIKFTREAVDEAQKTRDEFAKTGQQITQNTALIAAFGDRLDSVKKLAIDAGGGIASGLEAAIRGYQGLIELGMGMSVKEVKEGFQAIDAAAEASSQKKVFLEENSAEKIRAADERLADTVRKNQEGALQGQAKINLMSEDYNKIVDDTLKLGKDTVAYRENLIRLSTLGAQIDAETLKLEKDRPAALKESLKFFEDIDDIEKNNIENQTKLSKIQKEQAEYKESKLPLDKQAEDYAASILELKNQLKDKEMSIEDQIDKQNQLLELQKGLDTINKEIVEDKLKSEKKITAEKQKQLDLLNQSTSAQNLLDNKVNHFEFNGKSYSGQSENPEELAQASDQTLSDIIAKSRSQIQELEDTKFSGPSALAEAASGFLHRGEAEDVLHTNIDRAQFQLDQRNALRANDQIGGEDFARQNYTGDPLQFEQVYKQIVGTAGGGLGTDEKTKQAIISIDQKLPNLAQ